MQHDALTATVNPAPPAIIFTDLDGTLIDSHKRISAHAAATIRRVYEGGIPFCPVTARSPRGADPIWRQLGFSGPLAAFSGALVLDEAREPLFSCTIPLGMAIEIRRFLNAELANVVVNAFAFDTWMTDDKESPRVQAEERTVELSATACHDLEQAFDARGIHKFLLMGAPEDLTAAEARIRERFPGLNVARSNADLVEINEPGASKSQAVEVLCGHYGVRPAQAVAFGDGHNDIPLLAAVPESYAVANASDEVKRAAAHTLAWTNDEGAVARQLEVLFPEG